MNIFYINLNHEKTRLKYIQNQLKKINIQNAKRFLGLYGKHINIQKINELIKNNIIDNNPQWKNMNYNRAILAIYITHTNLWKHIMKHNNSEYSLIIEDDVILSENLKENIKKQIENMPNDWDILFIGRSFKLDGIKINNNLLKANPVHKEQTNHGMFAYIIKTKSIPKFIENLLPLKYDNLNHIDWSLRSLYNTKINAYYLIKPLVKHDYGIPSIKDQK